MNASIRVHSLPEINSAVSAHLLDGAIYPLLQELPAEKPTVSFHSVTPYKEQIIENYRVLAVPVNHTSAIGYQIRDDAGKALFYTGDTGPGLSKLWKHLSFQLLIIDTTFPNDYGGYARDTGHLTPNLLLDECIELRKIKKSLPRIICVHRDPLLGNKVEKEIAEVAAALDSPITVARENMEIVL